MKDKFAHMLGFLSNEIVSISKEIVGDKMLDDPYSVRKIISFFNLNVFL
jgi:hypothetical protein